MDSDLTNTVNTNCSLRVTLHECGSMLKHCNCYKRSPIVRSGRTGLHTPPELLQNSSSTPPDSYLGWIMDDMDGETIAPAAGGKPKPKWNTYVYNQHRLGGKPWTQNKDEVVPIKRLVQATVAEQQRLLKEGKLQLDHANSTRLAPPLLRTPIHGLWGRPLHGACSSHPSRPGLTVKMK